MRVLRVSHSAAAGQWRGRERALRSIGERVVLLAARRWHAGGAEVTLTPGEETDTIPVSTIGRHPALFLYDPRPLWRVLGERWSVIDIHEEPFALATAEVLLLRALRRNRAPVVLYTAQNLRKRYPIPFRWLERWALRKASGISACNADAATIAAEKGFAGRARVIPLGVDLDTFAPAKASETTGQASEDDLIRVGLIGRLVPEKGLWVLLDALAAEPRLHARIAGSGPLGEEIVARARARGIGDRVGLVGSRHPSEVPAFYGSVDVVAVPSLATKTWTEQFGRVAVEAMACGIPVVASDAGALPEVVGGAGIVVAEGDANALARALVEASGPRRDELRAAGFERAASCTWDAVAHEYLDLYGSVIHTQQYPVPLVEIVVVAYGAPALLREALEPIAGMPTTVVDNSSLPEIAALCHELGVRYIDPGFNGGFAAGVNVALSERLVPAGDVLLLNPDARIAPEQVAALQRALHAAPDLASVGPAQVDEHGRPARVEWFFPTPAKAWLEAVGLARLRRGPKYVIGSVLLLRAEAIDQVGGFDDSFFLYAEETDWAYRASRLGWRHREVPEMTVLHRGGGTSTDVARRDAHFFASQERYYRKHHAAVGWQLARTANWLGAIARGILLRGQRGAAARSRARRFRIGPMRVESALVRRAER